MKILNKLLNKLKIMTEKIKEASRSPLPKEVGEIKPESVQMDFLAAMKAISGGKKVTKLEWGDNKIYCAKKDGFLMIHKADDKFYRWTISDGDMDGDDWMII